MRVFITFIFLFLSFWGISQHSKTEQYIKKYRDIAVSEMHRTGIPASIKLAQGLLESNWGRSTLAVESNNHFGIKCSGNYEADGHYRYDDEYNALGKKKKSCFRVYNNAEESFFDHSNFLTDPNKKKRYGFLFEYSPDDYKSWAKGLRKAGYATDPKYASKLISIIEKHELWQYDQQIQIPGEEVVSILPALEEETSIEKEAFDYKISYHNSCKVVLIGHSMGLKKLSSKIGVSTRKMMKYNPTIKKKNALVRAGQMVYLEKKKGYYLGEQEFHRLMPGEKIADVAHKYGIHEDYLLSVNNLDTDQLPKAGDLLALKTSSRNSIARKQKDPQKSHRKEIRELLVDNGEYLFEKALKPFKQ